MKSFIKLCFLFTFLLLFTGCGSSLDDGWNGLYESNSDSNYYILLYTKDNKELSLGVAKKEGVLTTFPIAFDNITITSDNKASYNKDFFDDTVVFNIVRDGNKITLESSSTDSSSEINLISGTYTKYKNVSSNDVYKEFSN